MSAYVVDKNHIAFLVEAALYANPRSSFFHWINPATGKIGKLHAGDFDEATRVGQMLWDENLRSYNARYGETGGEQEYKHVRSFPRHTPGAVLKAIDGYWYQTCETDDWEKSDAFWFCYALKTSYGREVEGYENAAWEVTG